MAALHLTRIETSAGRARSPSSAPSWARKACKQSFSEHDVSRDKARSGTTGTSSGAGKDSSSPSASGWSCPKKSTSPTSTCCPVYPPRRSSHPVLWNPLRRAAASWVLRKAHGLVRMRTVLSKVGTVTTSRVPSPHNPRSDCCISTICEAYTASTVFRPTVTALATWGLSVNSTVVPQEVSFARARSSRAACSSLARRPRMCLPQPKGIEAVLSCSTNTCSTATA
mmetsp:Transcript_45034/g.119008  ORF Transcript_45034/g.119008 Transcript_45034/m.119008 type:complete len:225 (+) Transcript_45034:2831-3505(+)